jgi:AraC-like DNA-binding protein
LPVDTLSDLLRAVRLRGALYFFVEGIEPWVAEAPPARELAPMIMPGAGHLLEFHGVARGACWAAVVGDPPVRLEAGDIVLFPQGDGHVLSSAPGMRSESVDMRSLFDPRPAQLPFAISYGEEGVTTARLDGGGRGQATIVCGFLALDARPFNPLLSALPRMLHMPGAAAGEHSWIPTFLRTTVEESNHRRPGSEAMLERMSEMMFVEVLRRYVDMLPPEQTGWLAGLRDPGVGRALALLHERPDAAWTLETLGEQAGLSRTMLHERFVHFIGQPPMQYLTAWRMQLAATRLRDSDAKLIEIALDVGYESEAAFSRAFKRAAGESPGAWRRNRRAVAAAPANARPRRTA